MSASNKSNTTTAVPAIPDYTLGNLLFTLKSPSLTDFHASALQELLTTIKARSLAPLYDYLYHSELTLALGQELLPAWDQALYDELDAVNQTKIKELNQLIETTQEDDEGEMESLKAWVNLGEYYATIGDKANSIQTLRKALELSPSTGSKIDIHLTIVRLGFFFDDKVFTSAELEKVNALIERGGDWERRNRYKTYYGLFTASIRNFEVATQYLIDSLSTFTSTELISYEEIVEYTMILGALTLDRVDLKNKIIDSPEIIGLLPTTTSLESIAILTNALYTCDYATYFKALAKIDQDNLSKSKYLAPHRAFWVREMRRKAYAQLLESYKTLSLKSMADAFGVSVAFLDADLSKFIPQKRLNCVIDRVNGIVETTRLDTKNAQYQNLIKQGDALLTKLQKYGATVRLSAERV
ncbi:PCI-domain-containing protein [Nadsonia fulvescens var. elongata DSM 6958]|uniref:PCI-domain-containing protein n=1 Tax=Nadsonia fulvescens var. elongata DSM 6958 TaxID=857566 RepID=A0A1E3PHY4_9ASCO|nr:PCI-domain-containing protein [Nadsonia fulvescens var. elongata DSM 6958]